MEAKINRALGLTSYLAIFAPAIAVGWRIYLAMEGVGVVFRWLATVGFVLGFEGTGIRAGRLPERRWIVAYAMLGIGIVVMVETTQADGLAVGVGAMLLTVLAYLVAGATEAAEQARQAVVDERANDAVSAELAADAAAKREAADAAERQAAAEREMRLELARIEAEKEVKMARVANKAPANRPVATAAANVSTNHSAASATEFAALHEKYFAGKRGLSSLEPAAIEILKNGYSPAELQEITGKSARTIRDWKAELNG